MTMKKLGKRFFSTMLAVMLVLAMSVTAFAQVDEDINAEAPTEFIPDGSFSIPGNGEVLDDVSDPEREFYTITTANGNTYFLVIDKSGSNENVYMLSMIDEYDLQDFIDESQKHPQSNPPTTTVVIPNTEPSPAPTISEDTPPMQEKTIPNNALLTVLLLAVGGVAAFFYFKVYKPKQEEDYAPSENMEVNDGLETINEDRDEDEE